MITDKSCYEANIFDQRPDPSFGTGGIVHHGKVIASPIKAAGPMEHLGFHRLRLHHSGHAERREDRRDRSRPVCASARSRLQHGAGVIKFRKVRVKKLLVRRGSNDCSPYVCKYLPRPVTGAWLPYASTSSMSDTSQPGTARTGALDINEAFRSGGRSPEFLDQINKACIVMLDEAGIVPACACRAYCRRALPK